MGNHRIAFVTDSTAFIPRNLMEQYGIHFFSNLVNWGRQQFRDGVDLQPQQFFERLKSDPVLPTTAVASIGEIQSVFSRAAAEADAVVSIHISSDLSNTYTVALQASDMHASVPIKVIDSRLAGMSHGFLMLAAARAASEGASLEEVLRLIDVVRPNIGIWFTVETLEYLRRGGRIGGAAALLGGILDLKPILELRSGRIEPVERVRSKRKAVDRILDLMSERVAGKQSIRLAVMHAGAEEEAKGILADAAARVSPVVETAIADLSPSVGTHTGPGTVAVVYCHSV
jgi:DegV family protein with EDD domain